MLNTVVSESKRFCLDKVLCDRELLFSPDFKLILSSFKIQRKISGETVVRKKKPFPATRKLLQQRRKVNENQWSHLCSFNVNGQWAFSTCCKLLQSWHWAHTVGCDTAFFVTPLLEWDTCTATPKRIHLKMEAGLHCSLEVIALLPLCCH